MSDLNNETQAKVSLLTRLLQLLQEFGPVAADLKAIVARLVAEIRSESGLETSAIIALTGSELDSLDEDLARDLEHTAGQ